MKKILLLTMLILGLSVQAWAYGFVEGGIYYNITGDGTVEVTWGGSSASAGTDEYTGDIVVPSTVTHEGTTYAVTGIGASAFQTNKGLLTAYLPSSITSVGEHAFQGCTALTTVTFEENPNPVSFEGTYTFYGCEALESITLPSNMQTIVTQMFRGCSSLEKLEIPETVTSIEDRAFYGTGLKSIVIPDNVTKLGTSSTGTNGGVLRDCTSLEEAVIGDAVTTIEYQLFRGDTSLKKVTFGESCTEIGSNCFYGCSALEEIIMKCPEPPLAAFNSSGYSDGNFFKDVPETCVLYVPAGSKAAYEAANIWNELTIEESPVSYTDWLHVVVNGDDEGVVKSTVSVKYTDANTIDLTLHDFTVDIYSSGWISLYLGDVTVNGIQLGDEVDGVAKISCTGNKDVEYPDVDSQYASMIGGVSVDMTGEVSDTKLRANMDITVSLTLMGIVSLGDYLVTATFGYDYGEYLVVNAETGNYLGGGLAWGTVATEVGKPQFFSFLEQTDGTYNINGNQNGSTSIGRPDDASDSNFYVDAAKPLTWTVTEVDGGYTFQAENKYLTGQGFQKALTLESTAGSTAIWKLVTKDEVIATMDAATSESPVDVTPLIPAPEPKRNNWGGSWTATGYGVNAEPNNFSFGSDWLTASCAESYHSENGFDAHQTFSLPKAGFYTLTAQAFYRNDGSSKVLPSIYVTTGTSATDDSGTLTSLPLPVLDTEANSMESAYQEFLKELHPVSITFMIDNEGDEITVGFDSNVAEDNEMWTIFGELGLTYSGDYLPTLTAVEGVMNVDVEATQTSALAEYASSPSSATYSAALNAIQAATESVAFYEEVTAALATGEYEDVVATFDEAGQAAFQTDYLDAYEARTLTDQTVEDGLSDACKKQETLGSDMSYALKNSGKWVNAVGTTTANGTDNSSTNFGLCPQLPTAHEIYQYNLTDWKVTGRDVTEVKAIYKQVDGLPAGTYKLSFYAYGNVGETPANGRPLAYANDAEEQEVAYLADLGNAWTSASIYTFVCEVGEDGILEFGMKTQGDGYWYVCEECSLQYGVAEAEVVHDETTFDHWSIAGNTNGEFAYNTWSTEDDPSGMVTPFIQYWVGTGYQLSNATISHQTLSDLTPGFYVVSLDMRAFNEGSLNKIEPGIALSANGTSVDVSLGTHDVFNSVSAEAYGTYEVPCMVGEDGTLDIAITLTDCNCDWLAFKNVKVTYMGTEYELPAAADITPVDGDMSTAKSEAQEAAIEAYTASQSPTTAIALYQALADAQLCANFYAEVADAVAQLEDFLDKTGLACLEESENIVAYEAKTLEVTDMTDTYVTAVKAQTTAGSDMTYALKNSGEWVNAINATNFQQCPSLPSAHEVWSASAWTLGTGETSKAAIYKQIEGLPEGTYTLSFYAYGSEAETKSRPLAYANDVETEVAYASALEWNESSLYTFECTVDEDGILQFGMKTQGDGNWYVMEECNLIFEAVPFEPTTVSYTDNLHVVLSGEDEGVMKATVDVEYTAADVINFTLHDLAVGDYNVGNVTVTGITLEDDGDGVCTFSYSGSDVTISGGDFDSFIGWVTITIDISGEITEDKLLANMTVDVKMFGASLLSITADFGYDYDFAYEFVAEDWVASDNGRAPQSSITYNSDNTITVVANGQNNIALGNNTSASWWPAPEPDVITTANYTITEDQCYFVVIGSDLSTDTTVDANGNCDCYMWWMNGWNEGSQVPPTEVYVLDDEQVMFVWDISTYVTADADGVITLDGGTCFGLTSTADDHSATISDINFYTKEEVIATGISSVKEETETAVEGIYDMAGRKVSKAVKGVYIINGKKVLVK